MTSDNASKITTLLEVVSTLTIILLLHANSSIISVLTNLSSQENNLFTIISHSKTLHRYVASL